MTVSPGSNVLPFDFRQIPPGFSQPNNGLGSITVGKTVHIIGSTTTPSQINIGKMNIEDDLIVNTGTNSGTDINNAPTTTHVILSSGNNTVRTVVGGNFVYNAISGATIAIVVMDIQKKILFFVVGGLMR